MDADARDSEGTGATGGTCPVCKAGEVITISMAVDDNDLSFSTCHLCEAKWWHRDGERVELRSVIGLVAPRRS